MPTRYSALQSSIRALFMTHVLSWVPFVHLGVLRPSQCHKVFGPIVVRNAIDVMHMFAGLQGTAIRLLPHDTMFRHITLGIGTRVAGHKQHDVASLIDTTPLPFVAIRARFEPTRGMATKVWGRAPLEMARVSVGVICDVRCLPAPTLTNTRRNLIWTRCVTAIRAANPFVRSRGFLAMARQIGDGEPMPIAHRGIRVCGQFVHSLSTPTFTNTIRSLAGFGGVFSKCHIAPPTRVYHTNGG
jgi:hypothetical protein